MRRLTPYGYNRPEQLLPAFYRRRIRDGRDLYVFHGLRRPGAAPARRSWWARLFGGA